MVTWRRRFLHRRRASGLGDWAIMVHSLHRLMLTVSFVSLLCLVCLMLIQGSFRRCNQ